jgi:hypothetical protein
VAHTEPPKISTDTPSLPEGAADSSLEKQVAAMDNGHIEGDDEFECEVETDDEVDPETGEGYF